MNDSQFAAPGKNSVPVGPSRIRDTEAYISRIGCAVAWGQGCRRTILDVMDPLLALAIVRYPGKDNVVELAAWLEKETALTSRQAEEAAASLMGEAFAAPAFLAEGARAWDDLGWADAASVVATSYDTRWVHDYRGNPTTMVCGYDGENLGVKGQSAPEPWIVEARIELALPAPALANRPMTSVLNARRTRRRFTPGKTSLSDIATVCRWSLGRLAHDPYGFVSHTYIDAGPVVGFVLIDRECFPSQAFENQITPLWPTGRFVVSLYVPTTHRLAVFCATDDISGWADLLWDQSYGGGAGFALVIASDVRQYLHKYPIARSYNWMFVDAGAFMHTAIVAAEGVGMNVFQTPALNDSAISHLLQINPQEVIATYFALFGR